MGQNNKGTAIITGASSDIGATYAYRLANRGYNLILVARNSGRLYALATRLTDETGQSIEVLIADLANRVELARVENVVRTDASITLLLNNANVGAAASFLASDSDKMEAMIALNVIAVTRLVSIAARSFAARGTGTIVNVVSVSALVPEGPNGVFSASGAFVLTLSRSLHHEFADKGVRVQVVLRGAVETGAWGIGDIPAERLPGEIAMWADDVVDAGLAGLDQGELVTIPTLPDPRHWEAYEAARRALCPALSHRLAADRCGIG